MSEGGDQRFVDDDDSVYKNHILYFVPRDPNCAKLKQRLETHPVGDDVWEQNVMDLDPSSLPPWLNGVPILLVKDKKEAHRGNNIYKYLNDYLSADSFNLQPANAMSSTSFMNIDSVEAFTVEEDRGLVSGWDSHDFSDSFTSVHGATTFTLEDDLSKQSNGQPTNMNSASVRRSEKAAQQDAAAQTLIHQREAMDRQLMMRNQQYKGVHGR